MMRMAMLVLCSILALAGCSGSSGPSHAASEPAAAPAATSPASLGRVVLRDHVVTVHTGAGEPTFSLATHDGEVIAAALTQAELRERFPAISEQLEEAQARMDASLHTPARDERPDR